MALFRTSHSLDMSGLSFQALSPENLGPEGGWDEVHNADTFVHLRLGNADEGEDYEYDGTFLYTYDEFAALSLIEGQVTGYASEWHYHDYETDGTYYAGGWSISGIFVDAAAFAGGGSLSLIQQIFSGNDDIEGADGSDKLFGFAGEDELRGGMGRDTLDGGGGEDILFGGVGSDTYVVDHARDLVIEYAGEGIDHVQSFIDYELGVRLENLSLLGTAAVDAVGNRHDNKINGNIAANVIDGAGGVDTLAGGAGADVYLVALNASGLEDIVLESTAHAGNDTIQATGSFSFGSAAHIATPTGVEHVDISATGLSWLNVTGNDLNNGITGNAAANVLNGRGGADALRGGGGDDTLVGSLGRDALTGGGGRDLFDFDKILDSTVATASQDTITDFVRGEDRIDLSSIDARPATAGGQAFSFIGAAAFSAEGQVRCFSSAGFTYVQVNTAGAGGAEMVIRLAGVLGLTADDFVR